MEIARNAQGIRQLLVCSPTAEVYAFGSTDSSRNAMPVAAKRKAKLLKTFHATMLVTRVEEWCVDAETAEEAQALLAAGAGHRCHLGDCTQFQFESFLKD